MEAERAAAAAEALAAGKRIGIILVEVAGRRQLLDDFGYEECDRQGACLTELIRSTAPAVNWRPAGGGEEFSAIFACESREAAAAVAEQVCLAVAQGHAEGRLPYPATASIAVTCVDRVLDEPLLRLGRAWDAAWQADKTASASNRVWLLDLMTEPPSECPPARAR